MPKTSKTTKSKSSSDSRIDKISNFFDLERSFIVFSVVYLPVAVLFLNGGWIEQTILAVYTVVMVAVAVMLMIKFALFLSKSATNSDGNYGALFMMYVFQVLIPLLMLKLFGYITISMMPVRHYDLTCTLKRVFTDLYFYVFKYQSSLDWLIVGTFVVVSGLALWSIGKKK